MHSILLLFICFLTVNVELSSGIVIECEFMDYLSHWGKNYACVAKNLETTADNRTITGVKGIHTTGKTNDDVENFFVKGGNCALLPLNVGAFFKNLKIFYVMKSQVKTLTNEDLKGLDKLEIFDVSHNPIERLEKGFFDGKSTLKIISFFECSLKFIDSSALDPLINLREGHFQYNHCVDFRGDMTHLIPMLKIHLKNCDGTNRVDWNPSSNYSEYSETDYDNVDEEEDSKEMSLTTEINFYQSSTTGSPMNHQDHFVNQCQMTFVRRNAVLIIVLLVCVIIGILAFFGFYQYIKINRYTYTNSIRLREDF